MMETPGQIRERILAAVPGATVAVIENKAVPAQASLLVDAAHAVAVATFLRDDPALRFDLCSNVSGVDWQDRVVKTKAKVKRVVDGGEKEVEETQEEQIPGCLESVYHLFSTSLRHGPLAIRMRTENRADKNRLPSLTPVWRSCEFQEREVFDLYGIHFDNHPDLRRLLMWEEFTDHPMRKDYVDPDDCDYEPTAHDAVLKRARVFHSQRPDADGGECISGEKTNA
jgi:NADH-quinone oxidoreductase subunit C